ncbi:MAG: hypothetical protein R3F45_04470 [Gammaproteobacteria bacterium]
MNLNLPILHLGILALTAWIAGRTLLRQTSSPTAAGAIVMAAGIFGLAAFPNIPEIPQWATQPFALGLLVVWGFIAASYAASQLQGRLASHIAAPVDAFAVGTWVAGTAVMARMLLQGVPGWRGAALALGLAAFALWLWYLALVLRGFRAMLASPARLRATGRILLSAVSTQSLALLAWHLWPDAGFLRAPVTALIVLGFLFYGAGLVLVIQRYCREPSWTLAEDWDNTNCIVHGAMSISGLAVAYTGLLPEMVGLGTWLYVLIALLIVEAIEVARMIQRARRYGLRHGILAYHVSQWSRNFTFGMFYAFTLALAPALASTPALSPLMPLVRWLLGVGPYIVLFFLLVELGLWAGANVEFGTRAAMPRCPIVNEHLEEQRP